MLKKTLITSSLLLATSMANAGGYIGLNVGQTDYDLDPLDDGTSISLTGGYSINDHFAIEASYVDLGKAEYSESGGSASIEVDGLNFALVGIAPVGESVELFAKVGMYMWDAEADISAGEFSGSGSNDGTDMNWGVGAAVNVSESFALLFEYQTFTLEDEDATNMSLGARLSF